jgi:hypothetical protein
MVVLKFMRLTALLLLSFAAALPGAVRNFDVVVYGGTAGGVIAAYSAAREGMKTALVEPSVHLGGMVSGGLGWTDYGKKAVIGGYALEFYRRVGTYYEMGRYGWNPEPHVAEQILRAMIREAGVTLFEGQRLKERTGVRKVGLNVEEIFLESRDSFTARIFIDGSYEGDLMAQTGVSYAWGRESSAQYGEALAGVREKTPLHQFLVNVSPYDAAHKLLPEISAAKPAAPGSADKAVQAYNFRMCFSDAPANQVAFEKPARYDSSRYELLARLIRARTEADKRVPALGTLIKIDRIPNGKCTRRRPCPTDSPRSADGAS